MKWIALLLSLAGTTFFASCATTPRRAPSVEQLFRRADANGDGRVSRAEYENFMIEQLFAQYDKDGDGFITETEFVADGGTPEAFRNINASGSGKITLSEAKASPLIRKRLAQPFLEADINHSGYVTWDEFQAARERSRPYIR